MTRLAYWTVLAANEEVVLIDGLGEEAPVCEGKRPRVPAGEANTDFDVRPKVLGTFRQNDDADIKRHSSVFVEERAEVLAVSSTVVGERNQNPHRTSTVAEA